MINPGQFLLELVLVIAALALSRSLAGRQHRRFIIGFAALAAVVNCAFYYFAVGPLYLAWHNPFELPQFLNFAASCVLGWAYHKHGYEVAAVGHCVADWLALGVLPSLLFG
jgi:hypothetical protein